MSSSSVVVLWVEAHQPYELPVPAFIGRSRACQLEIDDPELATAHAELTQRTGHLWLVALRGELRLGGERVERQPLAVGQRWELAPRVTLEVLDIAIAGEDAPETSRRGPMPLRYELGAGRVIARSPLGRCEIVGVPAKILERLLTSERRSLPWEQLALACLPSYADVKSLHGRDRELARNALDQHLRVLRQRLGALGVVETLVYTVGGMVHLYWRGALDKVTAADG